MIHKNFKTSSNKFKLLWTFPVIALLFFGISCSKDVQKSIKEEVTQAAKSNDLPTDPKIGKCYAKCYNNSENKVIQKKEKVPVYTGNNASLKGLQVRSFTTKVPSSDWIKNEAGTWILKETPGETLTYLVVTDTEAIKDFEYKEITIYESIALHGPSEWEEVICNDQISEEFLKEVHTILVKEGYELKVVNGNTMTQEMKNVLWAFQKQNKLPVGNFNLKTLDALNMNYEKYLK